MQSPQSSVSASVVNLETPGNKPWNESSGEEEVSTGIGRSESVRGYRAGARGQAPEGARGIGVGGEVERPMSEEADDDGGRRTRSLDLEPGADVRLWTNWL